MQQGKAGLAIIFPICGVAGAELKEQVTTMQTEYSKVSHRLESEQGLSNQVHSEAVVRTLLTARQLLFPMTAFACIDPLCCTAALPVTPTCISDSDSNVSISLQEVS